MAEDEPKNEVKQIRGISLYRNAAPQTSSLKKEREKFYPTSRPSLVKVYPTGYQVPTLTKAFQEAPRKARSQALQLGASFKPRYDKRSIVPMSLVCSWTWVPELPWLMPWQVQWRLCLIPTLLQERQGSQQWGSGGFSHGSDDWAFQEMEHQL